MFPIQILQAIIDQILKFFKNKLINKNIKYIILDDKASVFEENIEDYKFLYECLKITKKQMNIILKYMN